GGGVPIERVTPRATNSALLGRLAREPLPVRALRARQHRARITARTAARVVAGSQLREVRSAPAPLRTSVAPRLPVRRPGLLKLPLPVKRMPRLLLRRCPQPTRLPGRLP